MDYSNFVVLLARQRSGTNVLRGVLQTHPEIFCVPEVFDNGMDTDYLIGGRNHGGSAYFNPGELSYINFLEKYAKGDIKKILLPDDHENIFLDFLEYLRCFTNKQLIVLDVKYMSTHHITKNWHFITEEPFFFSLLKEHNLRVLNLTRKNFLRYWLSESKAQQSQVWQELDEAVVSDKPWHIERKDSAIQRQEPRITVDTDELLEILRLCRSENKVVEDSFSEYEHYLTFDYDDMFAYIGAPLSSLVLERFAQWAGIDNSFAETMPEHKKLSRLTLEETIENYEAVVQALRGTEFEYCLEDEHMYRNEQWSTFQLEVPAHDTGENQPVYQKVNGQATVGGRALEERSTVTDFEKVIGLHPDDFCDAFYAEQPNWVQGTSISHFDARFLFKTALTAGTDLAVEIGTASGYSTALLCHALNFANLAGIIDSDFQIVTYDIDRNFYADHNRRTGDAAREQLPSELIEHLTFHNPAVAADLRHHYGNDEIRLMFIDANHKHPWPTLDLLASLDSLSPGAVVVLHDINLPIREPEFPHWGAKYLFDGLDLEKSVPQDDEVPNIGSIRIPEDKGPLRAQLLEILFAHEWQKDVEADYLAQLSVTRERGQARDHGSDPVQEPNLQER